MTSWIVVGNEVSGDEDLTFPTEAFGPFESEADARQWVDTAPTFDGAAYELQHPTIGRAQALHD